MRWLLVGLIVIHGLIHFMGPAKAFGLAELPQLSQPISRGTGLIWLSAGVTMLLAAALLVTAPRVWWVVGLAAVVISQVVIAGSWSDARFGTIANLIVLAAVVYGFASQGPLSLRAEYRRTVSLRTIEPSSTSLVTEADLERLPDPVRRYVRQSGAVGQPRVSHFTATFRGRIRGAASDPWMEFTSEQHNFIDDAARFFLMDAKRGGLPVDVLHAFSEGRATMRVRLLSLFPLVEMSGAEADRAETVTLFNDICLMAPGALIDPDIRWEPIDDRSARGHFTIGSNTISAVLSFNEAGELADFVSDDRFAASSDGKELTPMRWSTPVTDYRSFGPLRLMSRGTARWHPPEGAFPYLELEVLAVEMNGRPP